MTTVVPAAIRLPPSASCQLGCSPQTITPLKMAMTIPANPTRKSGAFTFGQSVLDRRDTAILQVNIVTTAIDPLFVDAMRPGGAIDVLRPAPV